MAWVSSSGGDVPRGERMQRLLALLVFVTVCMAVAGLGGAVTSTSVDTWYPTLHKPAFNPPDWVFAPVWTALLLLMAVAGWRVWIRPRSQARRAALVAFATQLMLNLLWSALFFGLQRIGLALIEVIVLLAVVGACTVLLGRVDRWAGVLFVPYVVWVGYASVLNFALWRLN